MDAPAHGGNPDPARPLTAAEGAVLIETMGRLTAAVERLADTVALLLRGAQRSPILRRFVPADGQE